MTLLVNNFFRFLFDKKTKMDVCGIYCILNLKNGKIYVGSSKHIGKRLSKHVCQLRDSSHRNMHLKSSLKQHGKENFICYVLEIQETYHEPALIDRETYWIEFYNAKDSKYGYNQKGPTRHPRAGVKWSEDEREMRKPNFYKKKFTLISPSGELVSAIGVKDFCKEHDLNYPTALSAVISGKNWQYCGWRLYDPIHPELIIPYKRKTISEESRRKISEMLKGRRHSPESVEKIKQSKLANPEGYSRSIQNLIDKGRRSQREDWLINPSGIVYHIKNLTKFCEEFKLRRSRVRDVVKGKNKQHKNWTSYNININGIPEVYIEKFY